MEKVLSCDQVHAALVRRVIENLAIDCLSNTQVTIKQNSTVGADNGAAIFAAAADITVDITASGVNGLDTGVEALSTWYYVYMIYNPVSGLVRGLLSASTTSPVLPSGYASSRLIGSVHNNGLGNFVPFTHVGNHVQYYDPRILFTGVLPTTWTTVDAGGRVPPISRDAEVSILTQLGITAIDVAFYYRSGIWVGAGSGGIMFMYKDATAGNNDEADMKQIILEHPGGENLLFSTYATGAQTYTEISVSGYFLTL
jgi:hypothetical protein